MIRRFNNRLAVLVTRGVATMWCAYVFAVIALISLPSTLQQTLAGGFHPIPLVSWVAQTFLQLVLLSVIMVGQQIQTQQLDDLHDKVTRHHREHMTLLRRGHHPAASPPPAPPGSRPAPPA